MRCQASQEIEDECCIIRLQCELEAGHSDTHHMTYYPGQWGEVHIPISWPGDGNRRKEFYRNQLKV